MKNNINVIIFDFDGVILESTKIKNKAFGDLYSMYGENIIKNVLEYDKDNQGVSRFNKIKFFHKEFLKKNISDDELKILANQYKNLILKKIVKCQFVTGSKEFIINNYKDYCFHIATGTPDDEIKYITKFLGIDEYFLSICGSPKEKCQIVKDIIEDNGYDNDNIVLIGDSDADYKAANDNSVKFIRRIHPNFDISLIKNSHALYDLTELGKILTKIF